LNQSGNIPSEIAKLSDLRYLAMEDGTISGTIPDLGDLTNLRFLDLDAQNLEGTIPESTYTLSTLETLDLNENSLTGEISPLIGDLTKLTFLQLDINSFIGSLPDVFQDFNLLGKYKLIFLHNLASFHR